MDRSLSIFSLKLCRSRLLRQKYLASTNKKDPAIRFPQLVEAVDISGTMAINPADRVFDIYNAKAYSLSWSW